MNHEEWRENALTLVWAHQGGCRWQCEDSGWGPGFFIGSARMVSALEHLLPRSSTVITHRAVSRAPWDTWSQVPSLVELRDGREGNSHRGNRMCSRNSAELGLEGTGSGL